MREEILARAYSILSSESKWAKRAWARCRTGQTCPPASNAARQWSLDGAIYFAAHDLGKTVDDATQVIESLEEAMDGKTALYWNDRASRKFVEVKGLLAAAIAEERSIA